MARWGSITNISQSNEIIVRARWCDSFLCKLRGLTLRRSLPSDEGLLLVEGAESRTATSIHMFLVFFPITVAWLDQEMRIVDLKIAHPWRIYFPSVPAKYILEGSKSLIERVTIGDQLAWTDA